MYRYASFNKPKHIAVAEMKVIPLLPCVNCQCLTIVMSLQSHLNCQSF